MTQLPQRALYLTTTTGFDDAFFKNLASCKTQVEAYTLTEQEYHSYFGRNRYSSFESYRISRNKRIRKK